jgi:cell division septation protein DedD
VPEAQAPSATRSAHSEPLAHAKGYAVQVGAFSEEAKAREIANRLKGLGYSASVWAKEGRYKVVAKGFADRPEAEKAQAALAKAGIKDPFIVPVE